MKVRRKIAWVLSLLMIFSLMGKVNLGVRAQGVGTTGNNGQRFDLTDGQSYTLNVTFNTNGGSQQPDNPPQEIQNPETIAVNVSEGADLLDTMGTNITVDGIALQNGTVTVENASTHKIGVLCAFGYSISKAVINGTEVAPEGEPEGWYYYNVADATSYDIKLYAGSSTYTIAWDNSGTLGADATVEHGKVEIVPSAGITDMTEDHTKGGHYAVDPGTMVTIKLIPDYGYQLKSTDLNGATVAAGSEVSTFTFEMPSTNLHLAALFVKTDDQVDCTASNVVSNVSIVNGGNAVSSGNLKMTVEDNSTYTTDVSGAVNDSDVTKVASVDLTLDNIVSQGNNSYWTSNITEFTNPINVGLKLDSAALSSGETYSIVRDHNGVLTELNTTYNSATGTITFDTNQFSTYTIVKKIAKQTTTQPSTPGQVVNDTKINNNACDSNLDESSAELLDKVLTQEEKARVANGEAAKIYLEVTDISASVSDADKALIEAKKGNATVGMYFDIDLFKQIGNDAAQIVTNTNGTVTISLKVPEKLLNKDSSVTRTYQMIRIHNGVAEVVDCKFDASTGKISFETDAFSTYALVYSDKNSEKNSDVVPKTGETSVVTFWICLAVVSGAGALYFGRKRLFIK